MRLSSVLLTFAAIVMAQSLQDPAKLEVKLSGASLIQSHQSVALSYCWIRDLHAIHFRRLRTSRLWRQRDGQVRQGPVLDRCLPVAE